LAGIGGVDFPVGLALALLPDLAEEVSFLAGTGGLVFDTAGAGFDGFAALAGGFGAAGFSGFEGLEGLVGRAGLDGLADGFFLAAGVFFLCLAMSGSVGWGV
jgi:hypothetical protein